MELCIKNIFSSWVILDGKYFKHIQFWVLCNNTNADGISDNLLLQNVLAPQWLIKKQDKRNGRLQELFTKES